MTSTMPKPRTANGLIRVKPTLLVMVAAALLAVVYMRFMPASSPHQGPLEPVIFATNTVYAGSCPIFIAQEKGYFTHEGVQVEVQPHTSGKAALDSVIQGKANLGTSADIPIVFAVSKGQAVAVVATIFATQSDYRIVGRKDKGIITPANLRGKRIGVTLGTSGHFVLDAFLNRQKLSMADVTVVDLKPEDLAAALVKGDIDAASTWEPYAGALIEQIGVNGAVFPANDVYDATFNVSATRAYAAGHQDTIKKVLRALISGAHVCKEMPEVAREVTAKVMRTDPAKLKPFWPSYRFGVGLDQSLLLALEDETRWANKNRLAGREEMPNYLNYLHLDGLLAVAPTAVTVIH